MGYPNVFGMGTSPSSGKPNMPNGQRRGPSLPARCLRLFPKDLKLLAGFASIDFHNGTEKYKSKKPNRVSRPKDIV